MVSLDRTHGTTYFHRTLLILTTIDNNHSISVISFTCLIFFINDAKRLRFIFVQAIADALVDGENIPSTTRFLEKFKIWFDEPVRVCIDRSDAFAGAIGLVFPNANITYDTWHNNETFQKHLGILMNNLKLTKDSDEYFSRELKEHICNLFYDLAGDPHINVAMQADKKLEECT